MSNQEAYWTLGIQLNRRIGDKTYESLRVYVPTNDDTKTLLKKVQAEGGEDRRLSFRAKIQGSRIVLTQVQPEAETPTHSPTVAERADQIIAVIAQLGGTSTWPTVREKLGLSPESTPSPFLVKQLRDKGLLTIKNPKTSTMIWKLTDKEKLNGWLSH